MPGNTAAAPNGHASTCVRCGYELAGLSLDSICPECSYPIARSLESRRWLRAADPRWLLSVCRGVKFLQWSQLAALAGLIFTPAAMLLVLLIGILLSGRWELRAAAGVATIAGIVGIGTPIVWALLSVVGSWIASAPTQPPFTLSWVARWSWRLSALAVPMAIGFSSATQRGVMLPSFMGAEFLLAAVQVIILWSLFSYLRGLSSYESKTQAMSAELAKSHALARKNLLGLLVLFGISWYILMSRGMSQPLMEFFWMFVALVFFLPMTRRVRRAMEAEMSSAASGIGPARLAPSAA